MSVQSNTTSITNSTEAFDYYCTKMPTGPMVWGIVSVLAACVGVPASMWLLWVLIQRQRNGFSNDVYMLNLTIMDLIFNIFSIPGVLNYLVWTDYFYSAIADILYCFNMSGRPLLMACVCVDCYMAVVHPITYIKRRHSSYRLVACAAIWGFTFLFGMLMIFNRSLFTSSYAVIPYLLSLPIIATCDLAILYTLKKPDPSRRSEVHPQKQRALQTITNSLVMTIMSYLPPLVVYGCQNFIPMSAQDKMCILSMPILIAPLIGSTIMPFLYLDNLHSLGDLQRCRCILP